MATMESPSAGYPPEIIGYVEPWISSPGDTVSVKISCTELEYTYKVVRIIQGVDAVNSPKKKYQVISAIPAGKVAGKYQLARPGSYGVVENWLPVPVKSVSGLKVSLYMQSWLPLAGHYQTLISTLDADAKTGFSAVLTETGSLEVWVGTGDAVIIIPVQFVAERKRWNKLTLGFLGTHVTCTVTPLPYFAKPGDGEIKVEYDMKSSFALAASDSLLLAASFAETASKASPRATNFFNGRIDSPTIKSFRGNSTTTLVKYDLARDMSSHRFVDVSGNDCHGKLVHAPTRAVPGHDWDGSEADWTKVRYGYGAIHFHEDDMDDAGWSTDFTVTLPPDAKSGAYAVYVESTNGKTSDYVPFFVRPGKQDAAEKAKKVAFVLSTFTYLAYANEHLYDTTRSSCIDVGPGFTMDDIVESEDLYRMKRRPDLGLSCYDVHNDDSGVVFSTSRRPILNIRPGYIMWAFKRPREFSADTMMIGFLEHLGIPYDVLTDHDLHERGVAALAGYNTAITGSHPEYPSLQSYNAYLAFARQGGNLMYLGGNGFYWVVNAEPHTSPHRIEIRRGDQGVRTFALPGAERISSTTGQAGGLWRARGMACNALFGVGFSGEGAGPGVPYKRTDLGRADDSVAWMFAGIGADELIGEFGVAESGGASGDEIDRYDVKNDSPVHVKVLASSIGHPDAFGIAPEDAAFPILNTLGTQNSDIRSDITYYVASGGGGVFSVGSINWFNSLGYKDYDNNVATLTGNVIRGFLAGIM